MFFCFVFFGQIFLSFLREGDPQRFVYKEKWAFSFEGLKTPEGLKGLYTAAAKINDILDY